MKRVNIFASIGVFAFVLLLGSSAAAQTFQKTENFDTDPGWDACNNIVPDNPAGFVNKYGFQPDVDIAGETNGPLGVAGGKISRNPISYYADGVGSLDPSTTPLTASGDVAIGFNNCSAQGNLLVGWFDKDSPLNWEEEGPDGEPRDPQINYLRHFIGFRTDQNDVIELMILGRDVRCEPDIAFTPGTCDNDNCCNLTCGLTWTFDISYDPNGGTAGPGGTGEGSITGTFNISGTEYTTTLDIEAAQRDGMNNLNRFGIVSMAIPMSEWPDGRNNSVRANIDNLEYTAQPVGACTGVVVPPPQPPEFFPCPNLSSCQILSEDDCTAQGGTYLGDGSDSDCPTGACSGLPGEGGGTVCQIVTEADCLAQDGTYDGDGTECQMDFNIPGDCNQDGTFDLSDVVHLLGFLFQGTPAALPCSTDEANLALLDCNQDGGVDLSDAIYKLAFLFQGGTPPPQEAGCTVIPNCPPNQACP